FIKETIGEEYLIPLIGVWDRVEDIDFDKLPNQFVLKINWGSGQNIIVKDKSKLDIEGTKVKLRYWMEPASNHYYYSYEWSYKNIEPKIICEQYIEQTDGNLFDYKVYCFNGEPKYIGVYVDRWSDNFTSVFYNDKWVKQDFNRIVSHIDKEIEKPILLDKMLYISSILSKYFHHVRVDFYQINNKLFFGELTLYTSAGIGKFEPQEWDYKFGELLELPKEKKQEYDVLDREDIIKEACNLEPIVKQYRDLEYNFHCTNINNTINSLNNELTNYNNTIKYIRHKNEELKLNLNWLSILSIFGIQLFAISNNSKYLRLTILGIKLTFKINEESINKIAWWIPIKSLRNKFRTKFKIEDQTRPDQTRPDQTRPDLIFILQIFIFIIIQKIKNYNLCCKILMQHRFFIAILKLKKG
ncbi:ATP-grasp fold amidoligase family protein, partial [Brachyspira pulli]|uniref:ATP-grasp fold amidoligase family protein n=1 Tax=Brachyspira pulli TaxID=310721 RepID=UPI003006CD5F